MNIQVWCTNAVQGVRRILHNVKRVVHYIK